LNKMVLLLFSLALLFLSQDLVAAKANAESTCDDGWIDMDGESCLKLGNPMQNASWFSVQTECDAMGAFLPELVTEAQKELFKDLALSYGNLFGQLPLFIGGSDLAHEGDWRWLGHGTPVTDIQWGEGSPETSPDNTKDCLTGDTGSNLWNDINCFETYDEVAFLCMSLQEGYSTTPGTPEATTTAPQTTQAPVACPDGWTGFMTSCYSANYGEVSWADAEQACQDMDNPANLVSIQTSDENEMLSSLVEDNSLFWIGGFRESNDEDSWQWSDGSDWDFTAWCQNSVTGICQDQPNNYAGDEVYVYGNLDGGYWGDSGDEGVKVAAYVCEFQP